MGVPQPHCLSQSGAIALFTSPGATRAAAGRQRPTSRSSLTYAMLPMAAAREMQKVKALRACSQHHFWPHLGTFAATMCISMGKYTCRHAGQHQPRLRRGVGRRAAEALRQWSCGEVWIIRWGAHRQGPEADGSDEAHQVVEEWQDQGLHKHTGHAFILSS